jgi:ATP-dependent DNA ligase
MLRLRPPLAPMDARSVDQIPIGPEWQYEPKWDGFRCLLFREGRSVTLQSKAKRSLNRYFPEVVAAAKRVGATRFVLDGELAIAKDRGFSFEDLLQRIHPAATRVRALAEATPAVLIVFDLLSLGNEVLLQQPLADRRMRLEQFAKRELRSTDVLHLSPATIRLSTAKSWLRRAGATLDGIIAKQRDLPYRAGERDGMQKVKLSRSADCVVGGFRYKEGTKIVGSLLLGLFDQHGLLNHVGFTSSLAKSETKLLTARLERLVASPGFTGSAPGGPSRWSTKRSAKWKPVRPRLVIEVSYDHFTGGRFRHGTKLLRWRPDKAPEQCRMDQIRQKKANPMTLLES